MALMHHVVTDVQIRKACNLLSLIDALALLFLLLAAENIALGDHNKLQHWILISFFDLAVTRHDLAGLYLVIVVFRIKSVQPLRHQIIRQTLRTRSRSRQQDHLISVLFVALQILYQKFKAVVVRIDRLRLDIQTCSDLQMRIFKVERHQRDASAPRKFSQNLLAGKKFPHLPRQYIPFFQALLHALRKFGLRRHSSLNAPRCLIQKHQRILFSKIIEQRDSFLAKIGQVGVQPGREPQLPGFLRHLVRRRLDAVRLLGLHLPAELFRNLLCFCQNARNTGVALLFGQHQFARRIDVDLVQILDRPLAFRIE